MLLFSQTLTQFEPFDWSLYRKVGHINSITSGFEYTYIATQEGGILRFNRYSNTFKDPITEAQGLSSNNVKAVHIDPETNILWAVTRNGIEYSFTGEADWSLIPFEDLGIIAASRGISLGSSTEHIWFRNGNNYLKLDRSSGILLGILLSPAEQEIVWSSHFEPLVTVPVELQNYHVMDNWILNLNQLIDPEGQIINITTYFWDNNGNAWIGSSDGSILIGDIQMETFYPYRPGLANNDIEALTGNQILWLGGVNYGDSEGLTIVHTKELSFNQIRFLSTVNLPPVSIYSAFEIGQEIMFGTNLGLVIFDKKNNFWRIIESGNLDFRLPIMNITGDNQKLWLGGRSGLVILDSEYKETVQTELSNLFRSARINDMLSHNGFIWIATPYQLYAVDTSEYEINDFNTIGNFINTTNKSKFFGEYWDLEAIDNDLYVACRYGIIKYDGIKSIWEIIVEPTVYNAIKINTMKIVDHYCFLGTDIGLLRVDLISGFHRIYNFEFIGHVNDMYILGESIWIATSKGLVRFLWKKDL
jgi:ligand-binding sensor domain-containing protein